jgi:glycosyltransferase involved in cell wall biosynthesis
MSRIAILSPTLAEADAVSNDVLGMSRVLAERGHDVRIFADEWSLRGHVVHETSTVSSFLEDDDDVLIYHHSIGWEKGFAALRDAPSRVVVKYHNVTPPEFFDGVDSRLAELCRQGREQLKFIARAGFDLCLADSAYNLSEMLASGALETNAAVVPPFHRADQLQTIHPNLEIVDRYSDGKTNLLMVGRVRPSKGHVDLIEAFATYYYHFDCQARLFIVGVEDQAYHSYSKLLRELDDLFCLDDAIVFTGAVPDDALKAYFLLADAFLMPSEHEGFSVPLVEAMAMKLPIVAYDATAISETVGDAGLVWRERDPFLMAESIARLEQDEELGVALGLNGWRRYQQHFSNAVIENRFLNALTSQGFAL